VSTTTGPAAQAAGRRTGALAPRLAWALAAAVVAVQITYPLLDGAALRASTVATVLLFAAASVVSAATTHGPRAAASLVAAVAGAGLLAEAVGVATGFPFGDYAYAGTLGPQVLGVPLLIPLAWVMMAWPTLLAGRAVTRRLLARPGPARRGAAGAARWLPPVLAGWALASWDLFLDPQMVEAGHWAFTDPTPALPGSPGVPLTNYAGWLLVALVMQAVLHRVVPDDASAPQRDGWGPPAALLAWTWLGSTLANLAFFGRPAVAAWGFVAMGAVVGPYLLELRRHRPGTARRPAAG
jgi:putative membrane protein